MYLYIYLVIVLHAAYNNNNMLFVIIGDANICQMLTMVLIGITMMVVVLISMAFCRFWLLMVVECFNFLLVCLEMW